MTPSQRVWLNLRVFSLPLWLCLLVGTSSVTFAQVPLPREPVRYSLVPSDVLLVKFRLSPEFDATLTVQPDGFITLPSLGEVQVGGLTLAQATAVVTQKASARLNDPEVTVELKDFVKPYLTVTGEVVNPGKVEWRGPTTALRAIMLAGGFRDTANKSQVLLIRPLSAQLGSTRVIDLKELLKPGSHEQAEVRPGDMLVVSQNRLTNVNRIVKLFNPGIYAPIPY